MKASILFLLCISIQAPAAHAGLFDSKPDKAKCQAEKQKSDALTARKESAAMDRSLMRSSPDPDERAMASYPDPNYTKLLSETLQAQSDYLKCLQGGESAETRSADSLLKRLLGGN